MNMLAVCGLILITIFLSLALKKQYPEMAMSLSIFAGVSILAVAVVQLVPAVDAIKRLVDKTSLAGEYGVILFKALGICLLTQMTADACRDAGEAGLAGKAELAGKVTLLLLSLPLFEKIGEIALSLMEP